MNGQKCATKPGKPARLTKGELMALYLGIDRQLIRESKTSSAIPPDDVMTAFMQVNYTDNDIDEIARLNVNELESLGSVFKRAVQAAKLKTGNIQVVKPVAKAVINAANVIKSATATPIRSNFTPAFNALTKGPVAKSFTYAFIPVNAPELARNPRVKEKRALQIEAINRIADELAVDREYVLKHIRNAIVTHYGKNPEQVLHDFSKGTEKEFVFRPDDLGNVDWAGLITAGAGLVTAVAGAATVFKKPNLPSTYDWNQPIPGSRNVTNDPGYTPDPWYKKPAGIVGIVLGATALAGGTYYALQD